MITTKHQNQIRVKPFNWLDNIGYYNPKIEGDIAAVKKLVSNSNLLFTGGISTYKEITIIIDNKDLTGISVMDLMSSNENRNTNRKTDTFKDLVTKILNDNNFEIAIKTVQTTNDNTTLRMKNVNSDHSLNFKDVILNNTMPVVFSGGGFSDLFRWEEESPILRKHGLATVLVREGRDIWEIELNGGPTTECNTCPDYKYEEQVDYYWPALISGIEKYSGQHKIQYVGLSHGCTVALDSLKNWSNGKNNAGYYFDTDTGTYLLTDLASNPVDTFVAVACPGNFTEMTTFIQIFNMTKDDVFSSLDSHTRGGTLRQKTTWYQGKVLLKDPGLYIKPAWGLLYWAGFITAGDNRMSKNIYQEFYNWINDPIQPNLGKNVSLNNILLIQGKSSGLSPLTSGITFPSSVDKQSDLIVPAKDMKVLCENVNSNNKYYASFNGATHGGVGTAIPDKENVKKQIKNFLRDKNLISDGTFEVNNNCGAI